MGDVEDEIADLSALECAAGNRLATIRRAKTALKMETLKADRSKRIISDHALIRYLERHMHVDIDGIRDFLRKIADEAVPAKDGEHHWHWSGVMLVLGDEGRVVTCLSPEQAEKWSNRKLRNGERIPAKDTQ